MPSCAMKILTQTILFKMGTQKYNKSCISATIPAVSNSLLISQKDLVLLNCHVFVQRP